MTLGLVDSMERPAPVRSIRRLCCELEIVAQSYIRKEPVMQRDITYVGIDSSKKMNQVAMLLPGKRESIEWKSSNNTKSIKQLLRKLSKEKQNKIKVCYEAGPTGYGLQRQFMAAGIDCIVIAPSLVPVKPGERIKTDRRDARKLAELLRAGLLTEVHPPSEEEESVRDLCRCREDAREDAMRLRHRMNKFLLRRSVGYPGKSWTKAHREWLRALSFNKEADQVVFDDYLKAIEHVEERLRTLEDKLTEISQREPYAYPVGWLRCFRGIDTITAMTIVSELHDFRRFHSARELMAYVGLVPSEDSTGERRRRGGITKAGNKHVRRVLIESAWHSRHRPGVSSTLRQRRLEQPGWVIAMADRAQERLHKKYWKLIVKGKAHAVAVTAVARELVGFIWAVLYHVDTGSDVAPQKTATKEYVLRNSDNNDGRRRCA